MKYFYGIIFLLLVHFSYACDCEIKPKLDIEDWNDSDIVFTGILTQVKENEKETNLTFSISEIYKGKINKKLIYYTVDEGTRHAIFHHVDSMFTGQKWIVFSTYFVKNNELVYELKKFERTNYCMLSKPIDDNDPYLTFINEIILYPNSKKKTYYKDKVTFAKGSLENNVATGGWKYFTDNDLDHYWEGVYVNGKRDGKWLERAINFKKERVIINEKIYKNGILKERIEYNYIGEKKMHEFFGKKKNRRFMYYQNAVFSKRIYNKISNTSTIERFKNGKSIEKVTKEGNYFNLQEH